MKTTHLITLGLSVLFYLGQALPVSAQSRAESRMYYKTMDLATVKDADKFLKKYPNSVFAPKVQQMKDSLLYIQFAQDNVSLIGKEEAVRVGGKALDAIGWKVKGQEHVLALDEDFTLRVLSPDGQLEETRSLQRYSMEESPKRLSLVLPMEVITPFGKQQQYVHFAYRNGNGEYVEALYLPNEDLLHQAIFYGTPVKDRIEGQSPELMGNVMQSDEVIWLAARLKENEALVPISEADYLSDTSIRWWLQKNPKAGTASKLSFGQLDPESSIVAAYRRASKESGKSSNVAVVTLRGYTLIVAGAKGGSKYSLVWCEPAGSGKYIRSFFFEKDGTTLDVVYYKGNTTFKNKISLPGQTITHLK